MTSQQVKIKKTVDGLVITTPGLQVSSTLSNKKELQQAIELSTAHQWLISRASAKQRATISSSGQIPSTQTQDFVLFGFYTSVKQVIENLVNIENLSIAEAIAMGNVLAKGQKIIANTALIHEQIKDALRYGKSAGVI